MLVILASCAFAVGRALGQRLEKLEHHVQDVFALPCVAAETIQPCNHILARLKIHVLTTHMFFPFMARPGNALLLQQHGRICG